MDTADRGVGAAARPRAEQVAGVGAVARPYRHVYISPHFDDIALSVGGVALSQAERGEPTLVVAVFTAPPPAALTGFAEFQHGAWGGAPDPWRDREAEERAAMSVLGADYLWLGYADAIYRGDQYLSDDDLFGPVKPGDAALASRLASELVGLARRLPGATLYLPLGVGHHVDHQLCGAAAADLVAAGATVAFYEDAPYALDAGAVEARLAAAPRALRPLRVEIGPLVEEKVQAIELYRSQVPWIFRHHGPAAEAVRRHAASLSARPGGYAERLWLAELGGPA